MNTPEITNIKNDESSDGKKVDVIMYSFEYKINNPNVEWALIRITKVKGEDFMRVYVHIFPKDKSKLVKVSNIYHGSRLAEDGSEPISFPRSHYLDNIDEGPCIDWWKSEKLNSEDYKKSILDGIKNQTSQQKLKKVFDKIDELNIKCDELIEKHNKKKQKEKELESQIEEIKDYLIHLEDMSKNSNTKMQHGATYTSNAKNGVVTLLYVIDGIQVEDTNFGRSENHTFKEAKLILNDKLLEVMSILNTFKKRFENDYFIRIHFKTNIVKIIITLEPEKQRGGSHFFTWV